jgi:hypothetical protein
MKVYSGVQLCASAPLIRQGAVLEFSSLLGAPEGIQRVVVRATDSGKKNKALERAELTREGICNPLLEPSDSAGACARKHNARVPRLS